MTAGTDFSANVAWAAEKLGLPGTSYESALNASDKERMRRCFAQAGIPSPEFVTMKSPPKDGYKLPFSWPAVVKPVDNMGARGCRRVDDFSGLKEAVAEALNFSRSGRAIIEEYMEGPEFSVDALVYQGEVTICGFADRHIFFPPYFIEMGHTMPSAMEGDQIKKMLDAFCGGIKALGITNGAAKGDIKLSPKGPMIGEIAARLSGGYMSGWTYPYSSGVLLTRGAIEIALGQRPTGLESEWNYVSAERAFISIPGRVSSIRGEEKAKIIPHVKDVFMRIKPGSAVNFPENNVSKCGNIISAAENREEAINAAENAARSILIRLEVNNKKTDSFLAVPPGKTLFPPDAFSLDARLLSALEALPEQLTSNSSHGGHGDASNLRFAAQRMQACSCASPLAPLRLGEMNSSANALRLFSFPEFSESGLKDYTGRSIEESLEAVRSLTGLELPLMTGKSEENTTFLGRSFWQALIRGGYQGAVYYIDSLVGSRE